MSLSDPIGDMIARIKNAQGRNHKKVELPSSNFKMRIADILKNEGFIKNYEISKENNKSTLSLELGVEVLVFLVFKNFEHAVFTKKWIVFQQFYE